MILRWDWHANLSPFAKSWALIFKIPEREKKREEDTCDSVVANEATVKTSPSSVVGKSDVCVREGVFKK